MTYGHLNYVDQPGRTPRAITGQTVVGRGATINTGPGSQAKLRFPDDSGLMLNPNTEITIKKANGRSTILKDGSLGATVDYLKLDLPSGRLFGALVMYSHGHETQTASASNKSPRQTNVKLASLSTYLPKGLLLAEAGENDVEMQWWQAAFEEKVKVEVDMPWGVTTIRGTMWSNKACEESGCPTRKTICPASQS